MKKMISMVICIFGVCSLIACGEQNREEAVSIVNTNENVDIETENESDTDNDETHSVENTDEDIEKQEIDLNLIEYQYSFEDQTVSVTGEPILDAGDFEKLYESVTLTDSIDLYIDANIYIGYTKPDISVSLMSKHEDWYMVSVGDRVRYAKVDEVDAVALRGVEQTETTVKIPNTEDKEVVVPASSDIPKTDSVQNIETIPEVPAQTSDKYTPDEAVSVYRSLMEAGGITWNPDLKDVSSWGTGWIELEKGQPEWLASTDLEAFAYGDTVGNPWTQYYLEVTGSDSDYVYFTEWHN